MSKHPAGLKNMFHLAHRICISFPVHHGCEKTPPAKFLGSLANLGALLLHSGCHTGSHCQDNAAWPVLLPWALPSEILSIRKGGRSEHSKAWAQRLIIDCYFWPHELLQMFDPFTSWFCQCLEFAFPKRRFILFVCLNLWSKNPSNIRRRPTPLPLLSAGPTCGNPSFAALKLRTGPEEIWRGQSPRWFPSRVVLGCPQFHLMSVIIEQQVQRIPYTHNWQEQHV